MIVDLCMQASWYFPRGIRTLLLVCFLSTDDTFTATVVYIDYGNREEIPFSMIRPLPTQFSTLPAQALSCSLRKLELPRHS